MLIFFPYSTQSIKSSQKFSHLLKKKNFSALLKKNVYFITRAALDIYRVRFLCNSLSNLRVSYGF